MFEICCDDGREFQVSAKEDIYTFIVEVIFGEDTRNVSARVHQEAVSAECFCEDSFDDESFCGLGFEIWRE